MTMRTDNRAAWTASRALLLAALLVAWLAPQLLAATKNQPKRDDAGVVRCANLIYADNRTSVCFSDKFLSEAARDTNIKVEPKFQPVHLGTAELFNYPFAVMTGEGSFRLTPEQRENLRLYLTGGGFLLASAGCSSETWDKSFRREIAEVFPDVRFERLTTEHPVFRTVYDIPTLRSKRTSAKPALEALTVEGRVVMIYSSDGLNDTANAGPSCCCCGGNEILNAKQVNVNLLAYALTH